VTGYIDLSTGGSSFPFSSIPLLGRPPRGLIIPADLSVNDNIPGIGSIQGIELHEGRNAVYIVTPGIGTSISSWWDKETGVLLETHFDFPYGSQTGAYTLKLVETNVWPRGFLGMDIWFYTAIFVLAVAVVSSVAVVIQRRKSAVSPLPSEVTRPLSCVLAFAHSCIVGIVCVVWFDQIGGWFMNNYTQSTGSILSGAFGVWWTNGFALLVGLIIGIIGGLLAWILPKEGLASMNLGAVLSVAAGVFVVLLVGSLLFGLGTWIHNHVVTSGGYVTPLLAQILSGVGIVVPLIVGCAATFVVLLIVFAIVSPTEKSAEITSIGRVKDDNFETTPRLYERIWDYLRRQETGGVNVNSPDMKKEIMKRLAYEFQDVNPRVLFKAYADFKNQPSHIATCRNCGETHDSTSECPKCGVRSINVTFELKCDKCGIIRADRWIQTRDGKVLTDVPHFIVHDLPTSCPTCGLFLDVPTRALESIWTFPSVSFVFDVNNGFRI
jgi:ribosomal protein L37E